VQSRRMAADLFSPDELNDAERVVSRHVPRTPAYTWPEIGAVLGAEVVTKHEDVTPTAAFKVRGGLVYLDRLVRERPTVPGIVSATRGNHGISLAFSGRAYGVPVVIVVPECNSREKNAAMRTLGAEVVVHGADLQESCQHSRVLARELGFEAVPTFHPDLVLGVATYAKELFDAAGPLDAVYVAVGMGSGICGLIAVRDQLGLDTRIIGVCAEGAPAQALTFAAGEVVSTPEARTFVDGVAARQPDPVAARIIRDGAARVITVSDDDTAEAIRAIWRCTHHLAEPAGAISLAGLIQEHERWQGRRVAFVLSGANMDTDMAALVLGGATPQVEPAPAALSA